MNAVSEWIANFFGHIDVSRIETIGIKGIHAIIVLLAALWITRLLQRGVDRRLRNENTSDDNAIRTYKSVVRFVVMVPAIFLAIHLMGVNLSSVFTTSGLFAVALAFAMKNISENLISGMMLRFERAISPGDVLETDGAMVRVKQIGLRATIVRTKDEKDLLIPNSQLVQTRVANFTYRDSVCRVWTMVGVAYSSDLNQVRNILEKVCAQMVGQSDQHAPEVLLTDFGASSVNYKVSVWIENPWIAGVFKSSLNEAIWWGLKDAGIVIAFPQLDIHLDDTFRQVDVQRQIRKE
ncbi:MAG: mechanosensitive ion channel domain-containing protein [Desulfobacterales bacterium]